MGEAFLRVLGAFALFVTAAVLLTTAVVQMLSGRYTLRTWFFATFAVALAVLGVSAIIAMQP